MRDTEQGVAAGDVLRNRLLEFAGMVQACETDAEVVALVDRVLPVFAGLLPTRDEMDALRVLIDRADSGWHRKAFGLEALDKLAALVPPGGKR